MIDYPFGVFCVGALGAPYATWAGPSVQNVGKAAIHMCWGGLCALSILDLAIPQDKMQCYTATKLGDLALQAITYFGTLFIYQYLAPELSTLTNIVTCITSVSTCWLINQKIKQEKMKDKPNEAKMVCLGYVCFALLSLFFGSIGCAIAPIYDLPKRI